MGRLNRRLVAVVLIVGGFFVRSGTIVTVADGDWYANPSLTRPIALIASNESRAAFGNVLSSQVGDGYRVIFSALANVNPRQFRQTIDSNTEPTVIVVKATSRAGRSQSIAELSVPQDGAYHYFSVDFFTDSDYSDLVVEKQAVNSIATLLIGEIRVSRLNVLHGTKYANSTLGQAIYSEMSEASLPNPSSVRFGTTLARQQFSATDRNLHSVRLNIERLFRFNQGELQIGLYKDGLLLSTASVPWQATISYRDARVASDYRVPLPARLEVGAEYEIVMTMSSDTPVGLLNRPRLKAGTKIVPQYVANEEMGDHSLLFGQIGQDIGGDQGRISYQNKGDVLGLLDAVEDEQVNTQTSNKDWGIVGLDVDCSVGLTYHLYSPDVITRYYVAMAYDLQGHPATTPKITASTDNSLWTDGVTDAKQSTIEKTVEGQAHDIYVSIGCVKGDGFLMQNLSIEAETKK